MAELNSTTGFLEVPGASLYYECAGQGYPLVLIHAGIADSRMWDEQVAAFAPRYRVIRYDVRGFGQTRLGAGSFANYEDVAALLDASGERILLAFRSGVQLRLTLRWRIQRWWPRW